jgi:hypothetical protein
MIPKVLIACEESQSTTIAFRKYGYEAYSCDIQDCSGGHPEWHIKGDAIKEAYSGKYQIIIAHPPCTYISRAGARWMHNSKGELNSERMVLALKAKEFFMKLLNAPAPFIAVENPTPLKCVGLPNYTQVIQPYEYGHPYSKRTLLWLKNLPELKPTNIIKEYVPFLPSNTGGKKRGQKATPKSISQKDSSKTFHGISEAMAIQWIRFIEDGIKEDTTDPFMKFSHQ